MKQIRCSCRECTNFVEAPNDFEFKYCCSGQDCGCYGQEINPVFCEQCEQVNMMKETKPETTTIPKELLDEVRGALQDILDRNEIQHWFNTDKQRQALTKLQAYMEG